MPDTTARKRQEAIYLESGPVFTINVPTDETIRLVVSEKRLYIVLYDMARFLGFKNEQRETYVRRALPRMYMTIVEGKKLTVGDYADCMSYMETLKGRRRERAILLRDALEAELRRNRDAMVFDRNVIADEMYKLSTILSGMRIAYTQLDAFMKTSPIKLIAEGTQSQLLMESAENSLAQRVLS